ncbi:MAG: hypothetical protein KAG61_06320 [Bacteriovoracaceae bacterium]|nr:hypothetical protein [Bacteriovoracaceae bacterium]
MKRKIIEINEDLCNGCGDCTTGCSEGALQIIDGKAKLVKEDFCDGFGDCIGTCPTGALQIIEREAAAFDEEATIEYLRETQGEEAVKKMVDAQREHHENEKKAKAEMKPMPSGGGCPGLRNFSLKKDTPKVAPAPLANSSAGPAQLIPSELTQWPVQLHLVNPSAPYLNGKELVIMSTCAPLASADCHWRYLKGRSVVVACPKLDNTGPYTEKLTQMLMQNDIPRVIIVRMEVPCCGGLSHFGADAVANCGKDVILEEHTIGVDGSLKSVKEL